MKEKHIKYSPQVIYGEYNIDKNFYRLVLWLHFLENIPEVVSIFSPKELWGLEETKKLDRTRASICSRVTNTYFVVEMEIGKERISLYLYSGDTVDIPKNKKLIGLQKGWANTIKKIIKNKKKKNPKTKIATAAAFFVGLLSLL